MRDQGARRGSRLSSGAFAALVLFVAFAVPALAASLGPSSPSLGAGGASVTSCDGDGIKVAVNLTGANVVSVTGSGIAAACEGLTMKATVTGGTASEGTVTVPAGGGTATATLAAAVSATESMRVDVVVTP